MRNSYSNVEAKVINRLLIVFAGTFETEDIDIFVYDCTKVRLTCRITLNDAYLNPLAYTGCPFEKVHDYMNNRSHYSDLIDYMDKNFGPNNF